MRLYVMSKRCRFYLFRRKGLLRFAVSIILLVVIISSFFSYLEKMILPSLEEISSYKASELINNYIDQAVIDVDKELENSQFIIVNRDNNGKIISIETNVNTVNTYAANISSKLERIIRSTGKERIPVPAGSLLGNSLFAATGKNIYIKVIPQGKVKVSPDSVFTGAGLNQTQHRIYMDVIVDVKIIFPMLKKNTCINRRVMVAETVIVGEVPQYMWPR